jgi:hypothetical protein
MEDSDSPPQLYGMHGLLVASEAPLHHSRRIKSGRPDLLVRLGAERQVPDDPPSGRVLAAVLRADGRPLYTVATESDCFLVRFHGTCDMEIDAGLGVATCYRQTDADEGLVSVLITGLLMSVVLVLRGHLVLHASAVQVGDGAVAFVGSSGMGKSTLATLLCAAGAPLVTDDVLRVDGEGFCRLGATEARLRPAAMSLQEDFDTTVPVRLTADNRSAITLPRATTDPLRLTALLVPRPSRVAPAVDVRWLARPDALVLLSSYPRVLGWRDAETLGQQFTQLAELVRRVPVGVATVPWGPPFPPETAAELLSELAVWSPDQPG